MDQSINKPTIIYDRFSQNIHFSLGILIGSKFIYIIEANFSIKLANGLSLLKKARLI